LRFFLPVASELTDSQYQLLVFFQGNILQHSAGAIPPLLDDDVAAAATAVAATLETAGKGIIYQHRATSIPAQRLVSAIENAFQELLNRAGSKSAALERDAVIALRRIAKAAEDAGRALPEDERPVYLRLLSRLMTPAAGAGAHDATPAATDPPRGGGLIITG
jgi:hypothetical protein